MDFMNGEEELCQRDEQQRLLRELAEEEQRRQFLSSGAFNHHHQQMPPIVDAAQLYFMANGLGLAPPLGMPIGAESPNGPIGNNGGFESSPIPPPPQTSFFVLPTQFDCQEEELEENNNNRNNKISAESDILLQQRTTTDQHSLATPPPSPKGNDQQHRSSNSPNARCQSMVAGSAAVCCRGCGLEIQDSHFLCLNRRQQQQMTTRSEEEECGGGSCDDPRARTAVEGDTECWHEGCLRCASCGQPLAALGSCFARDGRVYCREDHARLFGPSTRPQCSRCALPIGATEFVFRSAGGHVFHLQCFQCCCCGQTLAKGDQYLCVEGQLVCQRDFGLWQLQQQLAGTKFGPPPPLPMGSADHPSRLLSIPPFPELDFSLQRPIFSHHHGDRSKKMPKRPRTILNAPQRKAFKQAFDKGPKPSRKVREQLARETGLSVRVVQVWFQNQRAKMKKERKRELDKQQHQQKAGGSNNLGLGSSVGTDSDGGREDQQQQMMGMSRSPPQSGCSTGGKSELLADDDDSEMDPDEVGEEEEEEDDREEEDESMASCNSSNMVIALGQQQPSVNHPMEGGGQQMMADSLATGIPQNPIEKLYSMHQNYFAFV